MWRQGARNLAIISTLLLCALIVSGCAYSGMPRIDPTGEQFFIQEPVAANPDFGFEPSVQPPNDDDDVAVTLSPKTTVAPVGSEVVLIAGVRGPDNYLRTNRRLEWSLSSGGVGHFVAVGKNGPVDFLLGDFNRPRKIDNTFAVGSTSRQYLHLDRGTPTTADDVCVLAGQGWITVTSPVEGSSHVSVYAPEVHPWDGRMRNATIHWVDAQWSFPPPAINPAGTRHVMTTTVLRHSNQCPSPGWRVRYEIADGPPAGFAPDGASSIEVVTDEAGQAAVELFQKQPRPGINTINIQVIRPAGLGGTQGRQLVVGSGTTTKTWTAADLAIRKTGPAVAALGSTVEYRIEVSNPGGMAAEDVVLNDALPAALTHIESSPAAQLSGRKLQWRIGRLGPGESRSFALTCRVTQQGSITNCADVTAADGLKASDCAVTTVTTPSIDVRVTGPSQATVGGEAAFRIVVTNRSQVALKDLLLKDRFGAGLEHAVAASPIERELGELGPGQSREVSVTFRVTRAGRLCHTVEVTGPGKIKSTAEGCVTAVEQSTQPQTQPSTGRPSVSVKKSVATAPGEDAENPSRRVGQELRFTIDVTNTGDTRLSNLKVTDRYDASLRPDHATEGYRLEGNDLAWTIDSLAPGETSQFEVVCTCRTANARACNRVVISDAQGTLAEDEACLAIHATTGQLSVTVADWRDPVSIGKGLTYEIRMTNNGTSSIHQATLVATVPTEMTPDRIGSDGPTSATVDEQTVRFAPLPEISPGQTVTYRVRVTARQRGQVSLRVTVTSPDLPQGATAETTTEVVGSG